jgi:hypothetical protein
MITLDSTSIVVVRACGDDRASILTRRNLISVLHRLGISAHCTAFRGVYFDSFLSRTGSKSYALL